MKKRKIKKKADLRLSERDWVNAIYHSPCLPHLSPLAKAYVYGRGIPIVRVLDFDISLAEEGKTKAFPDKKSRPIRDKRYLALEIDLTAPKKDLMSAFKKTITSYKEFLSVNKTRYRETVCDHWEVYELRHKDGLNLLQIARKLSGEKGNPSYNSLLQSSYKQVKRAYNKACKMIEQANQYLLRE